MAVVERTRETIKEMMLPFCLAYGRRTDKIPNYT
jgi:hypothetical protein